MNWDYSNFKLFVESTKCDGSIPCYTGFHPHLLHEKNLYASCRVNRKMELLEIKENFHLKIINLKHILCRQLLF